MPGRYAKNTSVNENRSRGEIERTLIRYGATGFVYGWHADEAFVGFVAHGRQIKITLRIPTLADASVSPTGRKRSGKVALSKHAEMQRQKWRALLLIIKAKLEAVENNISTFDQEFLEWILLPDGRTVADVIIPQIEIAYREGTMPLLMPPNPDGSTDPSHAPNPKGSTIEGEFRDAF